LALEGWGAPHVDLAVYVLGKLETAQVAAFEAHLMECGRCQQDFEDLKSLPDLLARAVSERPVPAGLRARVLLAVRSTATASSGCSGHSRAQCRTTSRS
jgi:anti-sigma factor RsiW